MKAHRLGDCLDTAFAGRKIAPPDQSRPRKRGPRVSKQNAVQHCRQPSSSDRLPSFLFHHSHLQPTTSADNLQTLDEATLQEFREKAAQEEATRVPEVQEPESEPQRFNFHR